MFSLVFCVNNKTFAIFAPTNIFILANPLQMVRHGSMNLSRCWKIRKLQVQNFL